MGEIKKRLPLQCPACDAPVEGGQAFLRRVPHGGVRGF